MKVTFIRTPLGQKKALAGFSLLEMLLTVVVISIVSALALPNFSRAHQSILLKKQAEDVVYLMRYAQSRAINKSKPMKFLFDENFTSYRILEAQLDDYLDVEDVQYAPIKNRLGRVKKIGRDISVESDLRSIYFYPNGNIGKLSFEICNKSKCFMISTGMQRGSVYLLGPAENE